MQHAKVSRSVPATSWRSCSENPTVPFPFCRLCEAMRAVLTAGFKANDQCGLRCQGPLAKRRHWRERQRRLRAKEWELVARPKESFVIWYTSWQRQKPERNRAGVGSASRRQAAQRRTSKRGRERMKRSRRKRNPKKIPNASRSHQHKQQSTHRSGGVCRPKSRRRPKMV